MNVFGKAGLRVGVVMLAVSLLFSSCGQPAPEIRHEAVKFSELTYVRPDTDALAQKLKQAEAAIAQGQDAETVLTLYAEIRRELEALSDARVLANIYTNFDLANEFYAQETTALAEAYASLENGMVSLTALILNSPTLAGRARESWGADYIAHFQEKQKLVSPELEELKSRGAGLVSQYKQILNGEYTTTLFDEEVTADDLMERRSKLDPTQYGLMLVEIEKKQNADAALVYLELSECWRQEASALGFESVPEYFYASLSRDYTPQEALALAGQVGEYLVPVYRKWKVIPTTGSTSGEKTPEERLLFLREALQKDYPPEMLSALDYMTTNEMIDYSNGPNRMPGSFTDEFARYGAPFLYLDPSRDITSLFHEFGHYCNFYMTPALQWNDRQNMDLAEVHSQGLELLMHESYPDLYGGDAQAYQQQSVYQILKTAVAAFCEDAFQQAAQSSEDGMVTTAEELNKLYIKAYKDHKQFPDTPYHWTAIHQHFQSPFYYSAYGTSALAALELWTIAQTNRERALDIYARLLTYGANSDFRETLRKCGLRDPFSENYVKELADTLSALLLPVKE